MAKPALTSYREANPLTPEQERFLQALDDVVPADGGQARIALDSQQFWSLLESGVLLAEICKKAGISMASVRQSATADERRRLGEFNEQQRATMVDWAKLVLMEDLTGHPDSKDRSLDAGKSSRFVLQALDPAFQPKQEVTVNHVIKPIPTASLLLNQPVPAGSSRVLSSEFADPDDES